MDYLWPNGKNDNENKGNNKKWSQKNGNCKMNKTVKCCHFSIAIFSVSIVFCCLTTVTILLQISKMAGWTTLVFGKGLPLARGMLC